MKGIVWAVDYYQSWRFGLLHKRFLDFYFFRGKLFDKNKNTPTNGDCYLIAIMAFPPKQTPHYLEPADLTHLVGGLGQYHILVQPHRHHHTGSTQRFILPPSRPPPSLGSQPTQERNWPNPKHRDQGLAQTQTLQYTQCVPSWLSSPWYPQRRTWQLQQLASRRPSFRVLRRMGTAHRPACGLQGVLECTLTARYSSPSTPLPRQRAMPGRAGRT